MENTVTIVYFTAFSKKLKKIFDTDNEEFIRKELNDICETYILHSICSYQIINEKCLVLNTPFDPKTELSDIYFNKNNNNVENI